MSSVQQRLDTDPLPLLVCALMFLDPRRWIGALIAVFGVLVSIVAPFFPRLLLGRMVAEPVVVEMHRRVSIPRRPLSTSGQSIITASSRPARTRARPKTAGDAPLLPHVTFSFDRHPRFSAPSFIASSSNSNTLAVDSSPPHLDSKLPSIPPSPSSLPASLPPASPVPYIHPLALPSLDSLDLTADSDILTDKPPASPSHRRHFRVPMPKLAFGRRQSTTDLRCAQTSNLTLHSTSSDSTANPQNYPQPSFVEWHGTRAFAVRRTSITSASSIAAPLSDKAPLHSTPRRKFSLFSREASASSLYKNKDIPVDSLLVTPASQSSLPSSTSSTIQPVPELPSLTSKGMVTSLPADVAAPVRSRSVSYPVSHANFEDMIPLEQTSTPPPRPSRTDPYKTYGVPVPGSDRARAFLKAEKERIHAERERRERQRAASDQGTQPEAQVGSAGSGRRNSDQQGSSEKTKQQERKFGSGISKKGKELPRPHRLCPDDEADTEDEKHEEMEEFGVLPSVSATSASPQAQAPVRQTPSQVKRSWVFSRHSTEATGEKREKRREKKEKGKVKEKLVKDRSKAKDPDNAKARPRSRDSAHGSKKAFGFRSKDTPRNKDRGYSSDTNVPSLTYKLMCESS